MSMHDSAAATVTVDEPAAYSDDTQASSHALAFEFVRNLAAELTTGRVDLPSYPDVAIRVRQVLSDDDVTNDRIARVIASDAGLATRMLVMANSAALSRGGRPLTDLKLAVTRIGHDNVRSAALAYALAQIRAARALEHIRVELARLWEASTLVAALSRVIAVRTRAANPDEAMLAGLLHNVGSVYILARADRHSQLFSSEELRSEIICQWQAHIGKAIAQNWGLPERVAEAIGDQEVVERADAGPRDLMDVLSVAVRTAAGYGREVATQTLVAGMPAFQRLGLDGEAWARILEESDAEIAGLRAALGE